MSRPGKKGEDQAAEFLIGKGFSIISRNFYSPGGEIDIIALENDTLVFAEVKAWPSLGPEQLEWGINKRKQRRIIETAKYFLLSHREYNSMTIRFDVIFIGNQGITHFTAAFMEDLA